MKVFNTVIFILIETIKSLGYIVLGILTISVSLLKNTIYLLWCIVEQFISFCIKILKNITFFLFKIVFTLIKTPLVVIFKLFYFIFILPPLLSKLILKIFNKQNTSKIKHTNVSSKPVKNTTIPTKKDDMDIEETNGSYYEITINYGFIYKFFHSIKECFKSFPVFLRSLLTYISKKITLTLFSIKKLFKTFCFGTFKSITTFISHIQFVLKKYKKNLLEKSKYTSLKKQSKEKNIRLKYASITKSYKKNKNEREKNKTVSSKALKEKKQKRIWPFMFGILFALVFIMVPFEIYLWFRDLPKPELLIVEGSKKPTRILDKNGKLLYEIYVDRKYDPVSLDKLPSHVINATLAVEDSEFYNHSGIRIDRILKAAKKTLVDGEKQGASTITQQLIKNVLLTPERTVSRKIKEVVLSFFVESKYTKDQILELYLNNISYGGVAWGIQSASQKYFGKNVWELNLAEASMLAGLPSAPSAFSPLIDLDLAKQRQLHVLNRMNELGYITKTELVRAYEEKLIFADQIDYIRAPHFVQLVRNELENRYGKRVVEYGGLTVTTTLDLDLQESMEKIVKEEIEKSIDLNLTNGASVVIDIKNGGILGYVGSVDYFKEGWGAFDVASAYRQPGSSIKPITYALALEKGFTPATILKDEKVSYSQSNGTSYVPVNYDGKYHGDVTLRSALANSYNIPAVKLAQGVGPDTIVSTGNRMGLKNWEVDGNYGLSITLGGKEVKLLDHTNVFATFGRKGLFKDLTPFTSVKDSKGYELYKDTRVEFQAISSESSYLIWDILSDNNARIPAFGTNNYLSIPNYKVAVKTGTTDNKRDNWTMGFTPSYAIGVWVGNNNNTPMSPYLASGLTGAAPIWNRITTEVLSDKPNEIPAMPDAVFRKHDKDCNRSELFIKGSNVPQTLCPARNTEDSDEKKEKNDKND